MSEDDEAVGINARDLLVAGFIQSRLATLLFRLLECPFGEEPGASDKAGQSITKMPQHSNVFLQ